MAPITVLFSDLFKAVLCYRDHQAGDTLTNTALIISREKYRSPRAAEVYRRHVVEEPAAYYDVLKPLCSELEVWETIYQQPLTGKDPVAQFTSSTGLRPFLDLLAEPERTQFYEAYAALTAKAYPTRADGITIFPFRRLFIVARRA